MNAFLRFTPKTARTLMLISLVTLLSACASVPPVTSELRSELAPTGKLRAAINYGNLVLAQKDASTGEPRGISADLALELGKRLGVPVEFVTFDAAGKVFDALKTNAWDIAFLAIDPARATGIEFTAPYVVIEGTYLVPVNSPLRQIQDVDRAGIRVSVGNKSAYDLYLTRTLKHAQLIRAPSSPEALTAFEKDQLEVAAGVKQFLVQYARSHPEVRLMDGRFMAIEQAVGTPKGREAGARYLRQFVEEMKASGFIAQGLERSGQGEAAVAPASPVR